MLLIPDDFRKHFETFNMHDEESVIQHVDNASAWEWMRDQIPLFHCPDSRLEETYYFRWWVYRKHVKQTPDGFVITEFHPSVPWAGKHNTINCAVGHHLSEGRWLRNRQDFLKDYILFWFKRNGSLRSYSCWIADAVWNYCKVDGDFQLAIDLLPDMVTNYTEWEKTHLNPSGLFWSIDDRDAMEISISGSGLRPTLNAYMYADAIAIANIARLAGDFETERMFKEKANRLKQLVQEHLWDDQAQFFKVIPLKSARETVEQWEFQEMDPAHNVREQLGYIPWAFHLPDVGYEQAWAQLMDPAGFYAPFGPTTAEQRHTRFMFSYEHECLWNGPSWPFATSQTLTAMANVLNDYEQQVVNKEDYWNLLSTYAHCHYRTRADGKRVSWLDENIDPYTGEWLSRRILEEWNWPERKGGRERGKDYNHSTFNDLIITGLIGFRTRSDGSFEVNPLIPEGTWEYFCLDRLYYRGKNITIMYDKLGRQYNKDAGLAVYIDGVKAAYSAGLDRLVVHALDQ
ncbi:MGH1-like glycoside hydrolase domain-containing protein [Paenibacillus turpanensis]|uniref:MGH1-like glycoside hydrolase domain-containing protein n=1 Tax=Paenibacillus turpanensis TaxID=2689078 RepID=UPI00140AF171|nr:trehalase family glycosidase [Paenibacillus turpanensis]